MRIRVGALAGALLALTFAAASTLAAQAAASVCKDGTTSTATGRGACSGHGGVDAKATDAAKKAATKAEKSTSKAAATSAKATEKAEKTTEKAASKTAKTGATAAKNEAKTESKAEAKTAKTEAKAVEKTVTPKTKTSSTGADNNDPTNATAQCKDGTYSHAKNHQGACSNHGGVSKFLK